MKNRVCIFIDGSNFYFALKRNNYPTRVDYFELSKALAGPDRELSAPITTTLPLTLPSQPSNPKRNKPFLVPSARHPTWIYVLAASSRDRMEV